MNIQLHRFGDKVALSLIPHDGGTVYLTANEAEDLGTVLTAYATNVRRSTFVESEIGNAEVTVPNPSKHH